MKCVLCEEGEASACIKVCLDCIRQRWEEARSFAEEAHRKVALRYDLPYPPPQDKAGVRCGLCSIDCKIGPGKRGFCGLTKNEGGKLVRLAGTPEKGVVSCYHDLHPTNCVASWACGATGVGYPTYSVLPSREYGYKSLAIFYGSCTFRCLYCQNFSWFSMARDVSPVMSSQEVASWVDELTTCICFFGGCMPPQILHAIEVSRLARERKEGILRVCSETNGTENPKLLKRFAEISLEAGGGIKFDLKAWSEELNIALSGITNKHSFKNFQLLGEMHKDRPEVPFLRASTLLVPNYVDEQEVKQIAQFIASIDVEIPYSLLAFFPHFEMGDAGFTRKDFALRCKKLAEQVGLKKVRIGNPWLLR
jgi:pyruvate formate lyase activating enzyme